MGAQVSLVERGSVQGHLALEALRDRGAKGDVEASLAISVLPLVCVGRPCLHPQLMEMN